MAVKLIRLAHKIAIQLQVVAESCTICSSSLQATSPETFGYTLVLKNKSRLGRGQYKTAEM
jgi:hypothetical protein